MDFFLTNKTKNCPSHFTLYYIKHCLNISDIKTGFCVCVCV